MAEKQINGRIVHKHDIEANWNKAINFIPKNGEIIIYDPDSNYSYARVKVGDGTTKVTSLPFIDNAIKTAQTNLSDTVNSVKNNSITGLSVSGQTITYTKGNGTTGTITTQDNNTTYSAGTGLSLSGTTFNHKNSIPAATAQGDASKTLAFGDTFTIPTITYDAQGHITGKGTTTMTMPANPNSDTKVTQTVTTSNASYPLLLAPSGQTATATTTSYFDSGVTLNPSTNTIATNISGNAATATQLATARTIQTNLGSISPTSFNGTANITPGVTGTLSVANGGTGATTASGARTTLEVPSKTGDGASGTWGISISGNAAASTLASYTLKMQTYKIGSTTETYGTSYPLYAQWENNKVLRLRCDNNIVKTDIAQCLTYDDSFDLNRNSLQYFNISGSEGSAFKVNDAPTSAWWHIMRCTHNNSTGYYTDLAIPFNDIGLHYKRVSNGTVQNNGWIKVLDTLNYNSYSPTLTGGGASGTWGINVTGSSKSISYSDQLTTDDAINAFNTGSTFQVSTWNNTSSPGVSNGIIINAGWTNATYGVQIVIDDDPTYYIALRQKDNNGWNAWKRIPMGDGTGASGTWGISITGNAATATKATQDGNGNVITSKYTTLDTSQTISGTKTFSSEIKMTKGYYVHSAYGAQGTAGYVKIATLTITGAYQNAPISFKFIQRGVSIPTIISIGFANADNSDPALNYFVGYGVSVSWAYLYKSNTSTWDLYIQKSESYDTISIIDFNNTQDTMTSIAWTDTQVSTLPTGGTVCSYGGTIGEATKLSTARTLTIGNTGKAFDGSGNVSWSLSEIGAAASNHTHSYLPLSGGTLTGYLTLQNNATYPRLLFKSSSYDDSQGEMFYRILSDEASSNFLFRQYCRSSEDYSLLSTYEDFKLPQTTADRAYSGYYDILTTKSAVTVSQGGTGATTAAGARTNLGAYPQADMVFTTGGSEQTTSIKFDGKTVYRKVYSIGAVSANATKQIDTGLTTTIDIIFNLRGVARLSESQYRIPLPYTSNQSGYNYSLQMVGVGSTPKIQITAGTAAITSGFVILEYTKI